MPGIGQTLSHFRVVKKIGRGGMGEVYLADDTSLERKVALKFLPEAFTSDPERMARFQREARLLASLNHPNIAAIYGFEGSGGTNFLVMELVEGNTLDARIKVGAIPVEEVLKLALQIAEALEAAHEKGVIHRDLKPSNIIVTEKLVAKLLDFGLAKLYEQDQSKSDLPTADIPATQAGAILGTVAYMSPEQAQGQPVDLRSDIFCFGLVLYEMLSGKRAFYGNSASETIASLLRDAPSPLQTSPSLEKILKRCLEKNPEDRYQTMTEVKAALEKEVKLKVSVSSEESQPSIAVLPFLDMSPGRDNEWFSDGLAEEIINALTKIRGLKVIARTSAFAFRGKEQDIRQIAGALNVSNILEGSVRKAGDRIRVTAQLINATDGSHHWSERYDRDMTDVFAIQDEISQAIAEKLRVRLSGDLILIKKPTENIEAYSLCLKGRYHALKITEEGLVKCKQYFEQAINIDPNYALAWSGLASYYQLMSSVGRIPLKEADVHCLRSIEKALSIDETLADAHIQKAIFHARDCDWQGAEREFRHSMQLAPESTEAWRLYAYYYCLPMRRFEEAVDLNTRALELDPLLPVLKWCFGITYYLSRQWDLARKQFLSVFEVDPNYWLSHMFLGLTYIELRKPDEAIKECETASKLAGRNQYALGFLGWAYARVGMTGEAQKLLRELEDLACKTYVLPGVLAKIYAGLEDIERASHWVEKALDERQSDMLQIHLSPMYDSIRSHPRYKALLRKMNLEPM